MVSIFSNRHYSQSLAIEGRDGKIEIESWIIFYDLFYELVSLTGLLMLNKLLNTDFY